MSILWELFFCFFKIGLFTFGGGYAMIPLLKAELVERKKWISDDEIMDYYSIGQCTPGIIAINVSTFIGYKLKGFIGAIFAMAGMLTPSLIIIISIANVLEEYMENQYIVHAFSGIRIVVIALIFDVVLSMWKNGVTDYITGFIFVLALGLLVGLAISPVFVVFGAALIGLILRKGAEK